MTDDDADMDLNDRSIIVTGAARGIGLVAARTLLERGARVTICATTEEGTRAAVEHLGQVSRVVGVAADVSTPEGAKAVAAKAIKEFDAIDGLFANAGLYA
ncbi:MAG: SDR family NAD(P)-dependent oxidoreductase, partial [Solirubrobacterales bacterium]